ncbi:DUF3775 domain-containing protein [Paraburkholderia sp. SARCC-3016]|uniref:DUF3775 domain-containing protein n=1 Tax=Paraburkholderia sp. SARCC-3016 TaxID=3058611 RepID=UPI0028078B8A|nr:DUF3775 domain-containing protein [Paraburkholderia sp. SARCC-3016]MDQ7981901.1 DUF3775 domain-containing protein [Paraburkholderia sp. SARCC-3016]
MKPEMYDIIDKLVELDAEYRQAQRDKYPDGVTFPGKSGNEMMKDLLSREKPAILEALDELAKDEIITVMALAWWGRGDGVAEPGATFSAVRAHAESIYGEGSVSYVFGMPLSKYLPAALERGHID